MSVFVAGLSILIAIVAVVVAMIAFSRSAGLAARLGSLRRITNQIDDDLARVERELRILRRGQLQLEPPTVAAEHPVQDSGPRATPPPIPPPAERRMRRPVAPPTDRAPPIDWEKFVGRRVLGWVAVG